MRAKPNPIPGARDAAAPCQATRQSKTHGRCALKPRHQLHHRREQPVTTCCTVNYSHVIATYQVKQRASRPKTAAHQTTPPSCFTRSGNHEGPSGGVTRTHNCCGLPLAFLLSLQPTMPPGVGFGY